MCSGQMQRQVGAERDLRLETGGLTVLMLHAGQGRAISCYP